MKKYIYCALIAIITIACSKEEDILVDTPFVAPQTLNAQVPDFKSRAAMKYQPQSWDKSERANSRTYAEPRTDSTYIQYWSEGDAISVFLTRKNLKYTLQYRNESLDEGIFKLDDTFEEGRLQNTQYYYSVYPYNKNTYLDSKGKVTYTFPQTQHYNKQQKGDSYSKGENGMIAIEPFENSDSTLYFQNFCSYLQLRLAILPDEEPKTVKSITLITNNANEKISGVASINIDSEKNVPVVTMNTSGTYNKITLDCGDGVDLSSDTINPSKFWFVLPGDFKFLEGFNITVVFDDNTYYKKSTGNEITIARNHILPMKTLNPESSIKPVIEAIRYKYNNPNINKPYTLENTFFGEGGELLEIIDHKFDEKTQEWVVMLSGKLEAIGGNAFDQNGEDIEYIEICDNDNSVTINNYTFYNCTADSIIINNDVEKIGESAFSGSTIKKISINGNVTNIVQGASSGSDIEEIEITGRVESIDTQAFAGCTTLKSITMDNVEQINKQAFTGCSSLETVTIGNVGTIDEQAFYDCINLKDVITGNVEKINKQAFSGCKKIEHIKISDVGTIDEQAFSGCTDIKTVELGNVGNINNQAFDGCTSLQTVKMTKVENIGYRAFHNCNNLREVTIPGVKTLGMGAFRNCTSLEEITLDAVEIIGDNAFMDCSSLTTVMISEHCIMIGEGAFCNATNLETVYCYATEPPFIKTDYENLGDKSYVFDNVKSDIHIYIPKGSKKRYLDEYIFEYNEFDDTNIIPWINWWFEEEKYGDLLYEMD